MSRLTIKGVLAASLIASSMSLSAAVEVIEAETIEANPSAYAMVGDAVLGKPLEGAATLVGAIVFVATLPFSLLSGSTEQAADTLVKTPAESFLYRCLGCSPAQSEANRASQRLENY